METGDLGRILTQENTRFVQRAKQEGPPPKLSDDFKRETSGFLLLATRGIPPQPRTEIVYHEGTAGILPSPAKKIVAKDIMSQKPASPLKVVEEQEITDKLERPVDQLSFHMILEVNPATAASRTQMETTVGLLQAIGEHMKLKYVSPAQGWDILLRKERLVVHLLKANAVGNYSLQRIEISSPDDIADVIDKYQKSLGETLDFSPSDRPSSHQVARDILLTKVYNEVNQNKSPSRLDLPIFVFPELDRLRNSALAYNPFLSLDQLRGLDLKIFSWDKRFQRYEAVSLSGKEN